MQALIFAWKVVNLISSLGIFSKSVVRSVNPQTYTFYCVYSKEEINQDLRFKNFGKHINICWDLNCSYYRKIDKAFDFRSKFVSTAGEKFVESMFTNPLSVVTGGALSIVAWSAIIREEDKMLEKIENELKEKWENEQRNATNERIEQTEAETENNPQPENFQASAQTEIEERTENENNHSETPTREVIRPDGTVLTNMPREERLEVGRALSELVEQSGGKEEFEFKIKSLDKNFPYSIIARRRKDG